MNRTLIFNTIHRLLTRTISLLVLVGYGLFVLISLFSGSMRGEADTQSSASAAWFLTWILGSGLLGSDRQDGYLPLLLSRPISRAQYALSRWAGLVLCVLAVDLGLHLLIALFYASNAGSTGLEILPLLIRWLWFAYFVVLTAAWITLLSAVFNGHGDLLYFIGASLAALFLTGKLVGEGATMKLMQGLGWLWKPGETTQQCWSAMDRSGAAYSAIIYVAAAGVCLALAAYVMQRRDVSYVNR